MGLEYHYNTPFECYLIMTKSVLILIKVTIKKSQCPDFKFGSQRFCCFGSKCMADLLCRVVMQNTIVMLTFTSLYLIYRDFSNDATQSKKANSEF